MVLDVNPSNFSGFSAEVRADGLITDGGDNDFEGCDIDSHNSPIWINGEDKNTPNPLQTSTEAVLGIHDFKQNNVLIYQNSDSKLLIVKSNSNVAIKIYNLLGQKVKEVNKLMGEISIDISYLQKDLYLIHFSTDKKVFSKKMILI